MAKKAILVVMDGWGIAPDGPGNAIALAKTPNFSSFMSGYPHTNLGASGESVGLPRGEVGNTETGHLNIGAGRIVYQDLARINMSIADGSFFENQLLLDALSHITKTGGRMHLMGLLGAGGVHSAAEHLYALLRFASIHKLPDVLLHVFTDGRDSPPNAANTYISQLADVCTREGVGRIASLMGRYWAMDRDLRWDRTAKAYFALTKGEGKVFKSANEAVEEAYSKGQTDEFIEPSLICGDNDPTSCTIKDGDAIVFFNFRIDRPRQLTRSFVYDGSERGDWDFDPHAIDYEKKHQTARSAQIGFDRGSLLKNIYFVTMTEYEKSDAYKNVHVLFPPQYISMPLGRVVSESGLRQLRASESEKERFVTYYMNGLLESPLEGEVRLIVPSPKVPTYDLAPQMSAIELTNRVIEKMQMEEFSLVIVNFANVDMVGHTGNIPAAIAGIETVDACIGRLANYAIDNDYLLLITADHGNAEEMINPQTGAVSTEHSANPVPFVAIHKDFRGRQSVISTGILADVAPTILNYMQIEIPGSMMGRDLLFEYKKL